VRISFDDGNTSDVEIGLPGLLERGLSATFFVLAGRLDQPGSLSREEVRGLVAAGMRIGSHGMDHRPWRGLDEAALDRELVDARAELESVSGGTVDHAALPLGRYDRHVLRRARRTGYTQLHTSDRTWARGEAWLQPRFSLRRDDTVDSVRREMLTRASPAHRARRAAVITAKRLR
jgi:peptidoglycan/xylan/chitin deacetylase (PgdA/CDA1 family)